MNFKNLKLIIFICVFSCEAKQNNIKLNTIAKQCDTQQNKQNKEFEFRKSIDLMIIDGCILTMNKKKEIINNGAIAINLNEIIEVGTQTNLRKKYKAKKTINAKNSVVMPGFINGHTHIAMVLFRGFADDLNLSDWLNNYIWPAEKKFMTTDAVYWSSLLACIEMIRGGTTTFVDTYLHENEVALAVEKMCMRAILGHKSCGIDKDVNAKNNLKNFIEKWQKHELIKPAVSAHSPYKCSKQELINAKEISKFYKIPFLIHTSETKYEVNESLKKFNMRPIEYLNSIQILGDNLIAAHLVYVNDKEIELLKKNKVGVIHCPCSNMKLASGIAPVYKFLKTNLSIGLGTDGAASNNSLDMVNEMKIASLLQKVSRLNPKILPAYSTLELATISGAHAIGMQDNIGSLEKGKKADIIFIVIDSAHQTPVYNPVSQLVYASKASDVKTVIINGKIIMKDYKILLNINEKQIKNKVNKIKDDIVAFYKKNNR